MNVIDILSERKFDKVLSKHEDDYFNNESTISDKEYDELKEIYENLHGKREEGFESRDRKVKLPVFMNGLDKIQTKEQVDKFVRECGAEKIIVSDKIDGVSIYARRKDRELVLYTRGKGGIGSDVSDMKYYLEFPSCSFSVRGELVIFKKDFEKYNEKAEKKMKNPRNMTSGLVNRKEYDKDVSIMKYIVYRDYDEELPSAQWDNLRQLDFMTPFTLTLDVEEVTYERLLDIRNKRLEDAEYEIDGLVLQADVVSEDNDKNPKHMIAFKPDTDSKIVKVLRVDWQVSRHRVLTPVVIFEPTIIDGATLERVTAHNAKMIEEKHIGPGAKIRVRRSGGVIPHIIEVVEESEEDAFPLDLEWDWDDTRTKIILTEETDDVKIMKITNFFKELGCKNIDVKTIEKLYNNGIDTIDKMFLVTAKDLVKKKISGLGIKSAQKIEDEVSNCLKDKEVYEVMAASSIFPNLGKKRIKMILEYYPDIVDEPRGNILNRLCEIKGLKIKLANVFIKNLNRWIEFKNKLPQIEEETKIIFEDDRITDKNFVFSGFRSDVLQKKIEGMGGFVKSTVSSKTDYLVISDNSKGKQKREKAKELGVSIISPEELEEMLK